MKITVVCDLLSVMSGSAAAAKSLINALGDRGHEVVAVCTDQSRRGKEGYIVLPRLNSSSRTKIFYGRSGLTSEYKKRLEYAVWDSDAVYITRPAPIGKLALGLCVQHRIPVIAVFSAGMKGRGLYDAIACRRIYNGFYKYADAVIYPSEDVRTAFERAIGKDTRGVIADLSDEASHDLAEALLYEVR